MTNKRFLHKAYKVKRDDQAHEMYEAWAETYDIEVLDENDYQQPDRCAKTLVGLLDDRETEIIDIGCGTGLAGVALQKNGFQTVDGCDFSSAMLAKATKTNAYRRLFSANLNKPPIEAEDGAYGVATVVGVFSFGHVKADALDEIFRVVEKGGFVIICINEHFYDEGSLLNKIDRLAADGMISVLLKEHGAHLPNNDTTGWVIALKKL